MFLSSIEKHVAQTFGRIKDNREWKLDHHGPDRPAQHDHRGRGLQDLAYLSAFDNQPGENPGQGKNDSTNRALIHGGSLPGNEVGGIPEGEEPPSLRLSRSSWEIRPSPSAGNLRSCGSRLRNSPER